MNSADPIISYYHKSNIKLTLWVNFVQSCLNLFEISYGYSLNVTTKDKVKDNDSKTNNYTQTLLKEGRSSNSYKLQ